MNINNLCVEVCEVLKKSNIETVWDFYFRGEEDSLIDVGWEDSVMMGSDLEDERVKVVTNGVNKK